MRSLLCPFFLVALVSCVGAPPQPCTQCGDKCVDTQTDSKNCGTCGKTCSGGTSCSAGACVATCNNTQKLCGSTCIDVPTDVHNCGTCGNACPSGQVCTGGTCQGTCALGYAMCLSDAGTPYCADLTQNARDCGACGHVCGAAEACVLSTCTSECGTGRTLCSTGGGAPYCADTNTDPSNCGMCGNGCNAGTACNNGKCDVVCSAPLATCGSDAGMPAHYCANTQSDLLNCGGCGVTCPPSTLCSSGQCAPVFADSCDQLHTLFPALGDGDYTLYMRSKSYYPFRAYCADMDGGATVVTLTTACQPGGTGMCNGGAAPKDSGGYYVYGADAGLVLPGTAFGPKTYLSLSQTGQRQNYSEHDNSGFPQPPWPSALTNRWTKLRFDPASSLVRNDDFRFVVTSGLTQNILRTGLEFGQAARCQGALYGTANIDLRETPFSVDPANTWAANNSSGGSGFVTPAANGQVMSIFGGGGCGEYDLFTNPAGPHKLLLKTLGASCAAIKSASPSLPSGVYSMVDGAGPSGPDGGVLLPPTMYCDMANVSGGWTLVMKVDGFNPSSQFFFDSLLWTNEQTLNAGNPGLQHQEAKYETFMATPFTQIYIITADPNGMNQQSNVLTFPAQSSMFAAMQGGFLGTSTPTGQAGWTLLLLTAVKTLQPNCNQEGLNNFVPITGGGRARVRLGVIANEQADCFSPDSYAGIGGLVDPPGDCGSLTTFRGYSAGAWGGGSCGGGSADGGSFAYVYVR
jgi:hypothetical protein